MKTVEEVIGGLSIDDLKDIARQKYKQFHRNMAEAICEVDNQYGHVFGLETAKGHYFGCMRDLNLLNMWTPNMENFMDRH